MATTTSNHIFKEQIDIEHRLRSLFDYVLFNQTVIRSTIIIGV